MTTAFQLRDYQLDIATRAAALINQHGLAYLAMQVRTGKTLTALQTAANCGATLVLFLTKKKAIGSIKNDYVALQPAFELSIANYEQLQNIDVAAYDFIICDEAHCLGQYPKPAVRTRLLRDRAKGKPVLFLSGTPTPESDSQIYHQLWVCSRSPFADFTTFYKWAKEFVDIKTKYFYGRESNDYSCGLRNKIMAVCGHLFLTYSQQEAGFVQDVTEIVVPVQMQASTYYLAKVLLRDRVAIGASGAVVLGDTEVKLQQKLHQIFSGSVKDETGTGRVFDHSKALYIREHFAGQKVAIFYKFIAERAILREVLGDIFTSDPGLFAKTGPDVWFWSQIQSGREGTNLSSADCLIMFNIDHAAVSYQQARARLQTRDKTEACPLYWLFAVGGIEEKIYQAVHGKQDYTTRFFRRDFLAKEGRLA